jgi:hypothetical protein
MGRSIADTNGDGGDFNPTAILKEAGAMLKGVLVEKRNVKTQFGDKPVYVFKVLDASCRFTMGKERKEVQPEEGALVDAFAPTRLARQLAQVTAGETVTIVYKGTKKVGRGNPAHVFDVQVEG